VHIDEPAVILAFLSQPVDFQAIDRQPVSVLFVLLSPNVRSHLQLLSRLMFALHDDVFRQILKRQSRAETVEKRLRELDVSPSISQPE